MAKPTFRTLLLNAEQDQVNAELSPEDKEALPLFARTAFSDLIQEGGGDKKSALSKDSIFAA